MQHRAQRFIFGLPSLLVVVSSPGVVVALSPLLLLRQLLLEPVLSAPLRQLGLKTKKVPPMCMPTHTFLQTPNSVRQNRHLQIARPQPAAIRENKIYLL